MRDGTSFTRFEYQGVETKIFTHIGLKGIKKNPEDHKIIRVTKKIFTNKSGTYLQRNTE